MIHVTISVSYIKFYFSYILQPKCLTWNYPYTKSNLMIYNLSMLIKKWIPMVPCFRFFLITELKKMWNISFLRDFQIMDFSKKMISDERPFEWYIIWLWSEKNFFPTYQLWRHNILYLTRYVVFLAFRSYRFYQKLVST